MRSRFNKAFNYLKGKGIIKTQKEAASIIGMSEGNLSNALKGNERYLTETFIVRFNESFGEVFNIGWLLTGEGKMLKKDEDTYLDSIAPDPPEHIQYFFDKIDERDKEIKRLNEILIEKERENGNLRALISKLETMLQSNGIDSKQTGS